jgi:transglutaminase-like putative cysteine protease
MAIPPGAATMPLDRRSFVAWGVSAAGGMAVGSRAAEVTPPAYSVNPVVGDGRWIDAAPPREPAGYYDRRPFELTVGIEMRGRGNATNLRASTPVPAPHPEQPIEDVQIETEGCQARVHVVGDGAAQLLVSAAAIGGGQVIRATARYQLSIAKQYFGHERDRFPARQPRPAQDIRDRYLGNSPGIETGSAPVRRLFDTLRGPGSEHPWDFARRCWTWVRENIRPRIGPYTSVVKAIEETVGDCEEMAGVFVALCRRAEIPARLVWVPNHNWAEFYLVDDRGGGHWIPAHTACYPWFGWTGVHELVIQKGDRVIPAHARSAQRLLEDWGQAAGPRPAYRWTAALVPLPAEEGADPGPGGRVKQPSGEWKLSGHRLDKLLRRQ